MILYTILLKNIEIEIMISKENLFRLFEDDELTEGEVKQKENIMNLGMAVKMFKSRKNFKGAILDFLKEEKIDSDQINSDGIMDRILYQRCFQYLSLLPTTEDLYEGVLDMYDYQELSHIFQSLIQYFEEEELYLNCAHILNLSNQLEEGKNNLES